MKATSRLTADIPRPLFLKLKAKLTLKNQTIQQWAEKQAKKEVGEK